MSEPAPPARVPRSELNARLASQDATIAKYESRLKDVVRAYKGVVKEKEALEVKGMIEEKCVLEGIEAGWCQT